MANRFGTDIMLDENYDIVFKADGDMMTTQDYENQQTNTRFEGYYSIIRAIVNRLTTNKGEYPFDPDYGGGLEQMISAPIDHHYTSNLSMLVSAELKKDNRIQEVIGVQSEVLQKTFVVISAQVKLIGDDSVSDLVFPRMFIP